MIIVCGINLVILFFKCVILWINVDEINEYCFDGVKNIVLKCELSWWFILVNWNLYLKLDIVCNFCSIVVVFCLWKKFINKLLKFINLILLRWFNDVLVKFICFFKLKRGFLWWLMVMVIIILLNICDVRVIKLIWLLVIGLKVFG